MQIRDIGFDDNRYTATDEKGRSAVIYDFDDRYNNFSSFPIEQQGKIFSQFVNQVSASEIGVESKVTAAILIALYMRIMSGYSYPVTFFELGNDFPRSLLNNLANRFHRKNVFVDGRDTNNYQSIKDKSVSLAIINYDMIAKGGEIFFSEVRRILKADGKILLYSERCSIQNIDILSEGYTVEFFEVGDCAGVKLISSTQSEKIPDNVSVGLAELESCLDTLYDALIECGEDKWEENADAFLGGISIVEEYIFANSEYLCKMKYPINEVKNAVLDLRCEKKLYGESTEYFADVLAEKFGEWKKSIAATK